MKRLLFLFVFFLWLNHARADQPVFGCMPSYGQSDTVCAANFSSTTSAFIGKPSSAVLAIIVR